MLKASNLYSILKVHGPHLKAGHKVFAHTFYTYYHMNAASCMLIFHAVVAARNNLQSQKERIKIFRGRQGEAVEDTNCPACAQLIFIDFHLKLLASRHGMKRSLFLLQQYFSKT